VVLGVYSYIAARTPSALGVRYGFDSGAKADTALVHPDSCSASFAQIRLLACADRRMLSQLTKMLRALRQEIRLPQQGTWSSLNIPAAFFDHPMPATNNPPSTMRHDAGGRP
jgi:hypothetical protein